MLPWALDSTDVLCDNFLPAEENHLTTRNLMTPLHTNIDIGGLLIRSIHIYMNTSHIRIYPGTNAATNLISATTHIFPAVGS